MKALTRIGGLALLGAWLAVGTAGDAMAAVDTADRDSAVEAEIQRGDDLIAARDFSGARAAYRKAADLERDAGMLPDAALRRIANSYYFEGKLRSAAGVLDDLAEEAIPHGDLPAQAWAIADAALLYGKLGHASSVKDRVVRLERLLASAYMPGDVRERITRTRLAGDVLALLK